MKISCPSCEAKYSIADEKVQGKVAKIRCKKCGATIVVGGQGAAEPQPSAPVASSGDASYSVSVSEGDQRTMTLPELVDAYNQGIVTGDTYVWTDGMDDWKAIADVGEIVGALGGGAPAETPAPEEPPAPAHEPVAAPAARRDSSRKGVDLFGGGEGVAPAPVPTPMAAPSGPVGGDLGALTGARNEQSTLFSLSALQQAAEKGRPSSPGSGPTSGAAEKKTTEDSGLIDLSALAKAASSESAHAAPPLMMAAPVLGAPVLGAPSFETGPAAAPPPPAKSNTGLLIGVAIGVAGVAIALALVFTRSAPAPAPPAAATTTAVAEPAKAPEPAATATSTAQDPEKAQADATASTAKAPTGPAGAKHGGAAAPGKPGAAAPPGKPGAKAPDAPPAAPPPKAAGGNPCGCPPGDLMCNMKCSTKKK